MQKLLLFILLCYAENTSAQHNFFSLQGRVNLPAGLVYLQIPGNDGMSWVYTDSARINADGQFSFEGKLQEPRLSLIKASSKGKTYSNYFFLSPTSQKIILSTNNFQSPKITGSFAQKEYDTLNHIKDLIRKKYTREDRMWDDLQAKYPDAERNDSIQNILDSLYGIFLTRAEELQNEDIQSSGIILHPL